MLSQRPVNLDIDKDFVLDLYCLRHWEDLPSWACSSAFKQYRDGWLATSEPQTLLEDLEDSALDQRTLAEVWLEDERPVGFLWLTFSELGSYNVTFAEIRSLVVATGHQRRGIGGMMLHRAEEEAQRHGAVCLRSEMAEDNEAARAMHGKQGFKVVTYQYEKLLGANA